MQQKTIFDDLQAANPDSEPDFEAMIAELEKIVGQLEGELKLEQALALFEKGLGLSQQCEKFLKSAEHKIEILKKTAAGMQTEKFDSDGETV